MGAVVGLTLTVFSQAALSTKAQKKKLKDF